MKFTPRGSSLWSLGCLWLLLGCWLACGMGQAFALTLVVTNTSDSGSGSLRQAILDANSDSGLDTITFQIVGTPPFSIIPATVLPPLTDPVIIDGTTQPGWVGIPVIEINGTNLTGNASADGLQLQASGCSVIGLAINRCPRDGIRIQGPGGTNIIQGNFLGTDVTGLIARTNGESGLYVFRSAGNTIGGTSAAARNLISGNPNGMYLDGASNNLVQGNFIGTTITGATALGNAQNGIIISSAAQNTIGGTSTGAGNIISGNGQSGIFLLNAGAIGNLIQGNLIGTSTLGATALGNTADGITISGGVANTIGGTTAGARNIISGNLRHGIFIGSNPAASNVVQGNYIGTDLTGKIAVPNHTNGVEIAGVPNNTIGGTTAGAGNVISGNSQSGVVIITAGATNNSVQGNFIGVDMTGGKALANGTGGVKLDGVTGNLVGGALAGAGNVISGNSQNGVYILDTGGGTNSVQGNFIGTDSTGKTAIGNGQAGVRIEVPGNTIGGTNTGAGNVISGNLQSGLFVFSSTASNNVIAGNYIGVDITGATALGNGIAGVGLSNAPANLIGGTTAGARNIISGNADAGVKLQGVGVTGNIIAGNYIGTDASGNTALGNVLGGLAFYGSPNNTVGGAVAGAGNLISGNSFEGISIGNLGANGNIIQGNFIGTKADGVSPLGNQLHNIDILSNASFTLIGGSTPAADNRIAFTRTAGYDGVRIRPDQGCTANFISRNSFFSNGISSANGLAIDLSPDGVTVSNMPTLTEAVSSATHSAVKGSLTGFAASKPFLIQFYANITPNISGYGEGLTFLGSTNITTDATGHANFTVAFAAPVTPGQFMASTATDNGSNTFEFSLNATVVAAPVLKISPTAGKVLVTNGVTQVVTTNSVPLLSWPTIPPGFVLVTTTNLAPPVTWTLATNTMVTSGSTNTVTLGNNTNGNAFYRLLFQ